MMGLLMSKQEIGDIFTKPGIEKLKVGQILRFDYEGSLQEFRITKLNRKSGKVWVEDVQTYHPDEVQIKDAFGDKEAFDTEKLNG